MVNPNKEQFFTQDGKLKFNKHNNYCGRTDCAIFDRCGQALRDIDKHRLIDKGIVPAIDTGSDALCFQEEELSPKTSSAEEVTVEEMLGTEKETSPEPDEPDWPIKFM